MRREWWRAWALGGALLVAGRAEALSLSLVTATPVIGIGQVAFVDVLLGDLLEGQALRAFDLDVVFDAPPLAFSSLAFDAFLGTPPAEASTSGGPLAAGVIDLAATSVLSNDALLERQPGSFRLARIGLRGIDLGLAQVGLGPAELVGLGGVLLPVSPGEGLSIQVIVPEASAAALLALGVAGLALRRRQRRAARDRKA